MLIIQNPKGINHPIGRNELRVDSFDYATVTEGEGKILQDELNAQHWKYTERLDRELTAEKEKVRQLNLNIIRLEDAHMKRSRTSGTELYAREEEIRKLQKEKEELHKTIGKKTAKLSRAATEITQLSSQIDGWMKLNSKDPTYIERQSLKDALKDRDEQILQLENRLAEIRKDYSGQSLRIQLDNSTSEVNEYKNKVAEQDKEDKLKRIIIEETQKSLALSRVDPEKKYREKIDNLCFEIKGLEEQVEEYKTKALSADNSLHISEEANNELYKQITKSVKYLLHSNNVNKGNMSTDTYTITSILNKLEEAYSTIKVELND